MEDSPKSQESSNKKPLTEKELRKLRDLHGKEGVFSDYLNEIVTVLLYCEDILGDPNYKTEGTEELKREKISGIIKNYPSYTEYISTKGLPDFLSDKGRNIAKRLDEIAVEIKSFSNENPSNIDIVRLKNLLMEVKGLIRNQ